jgi:TonB family protein
MRKEALAFQDREWSNEAGLGGGEMKPESRRKAKGMRLWRCWGLLAAVILTSGPGNAAAQGKGANAPAPQANKPAEDPENVTVQLLTRVSAADRLGLRRYVPILKKQTKDQWMTVLPAKVQAPESAAGTVQIDGLVHTDGRVTNLTLKQSSGDEALDRAAWAAITGAAYDAFPYGLSVDEVRVRFTFVYNQGNAVPAAHQGNAVPAAKAAAHP